MAMEPINSIPTDNLYKFMSISGLLIIIISIYYPFESKYDSMSTKAEIQLKLTEYSYNLKSYSEHQAKLNEYVKKITTDINEATSLHQEFTQKVKTNKLKRSEYLSYLKEADMLDSIIEDQEKELEIKLNEINEVKRKLDIELAKIKHQEKLSELNENKITFYNSVLRFGVLFGVAITAYGFVFWFKIQKALDKKLRRK
jgi:hypothetical protein